MSHRGFTQSIFRTHLLREICSYWRFGELSCVLSVVSETATNEPGAFEAKKLGFIVQFLTTSCST